MRDSRASARTSRRAPLRCSASSTRTSAVRDRDAVAVGAVFVVELTVDHAQRLGRLRGEEEILVARRATVEELHEELTVGEAAAPRGRLEAVRHEVEVLRPALLQRD